MEYNLLLKQYDHHCNLFFDGKITLELFMLIENEYIKRYKLFIINLN
jgi:hypothetical protein